ncbi:hypothetical protein HZA55_08210 [Candidatus Poribacteria bacterium]|nr:hypothetical protein [Candidatus Poribacteria bacterium]
MQTVKGEFYRSYVKASVSVDLLNDYFLENTELNLINLEKETKEAKDENSRNKINKAIEFWRTIKSIQAIK